MTIEQDFVVQGKTLLEYWIKHRDAVLISDDFEEGQFSLRSEDLILDTWYQVKNLKDHMIHVVEISCVDSLDELEKWI